MSKSNSKTTFEDIKDNLVSYWTDTREIHTVKRDQNFFIIMGTYFDKNVDDKPCYRVGLCYETYPTSRGKNTPLMVPLEASLIFLNGLLIEKSTEKNIDEINIIIEAIKRLRKELAERHKQGN